MIWYKNIRLILDACKILKDRGEDFRLLMVGFGANENAIQKYFRKLGLADKIIYTGKVLDRAEIQGYYGISDLLLFPSVFDTNGLVVREAASCATPSLLVAGSCAAEGITDDRNGFLCLESAHSIAVRLQQIMHHKDYLHRVGKAAQEEIYISWDDAVRRAYDRYHIVIDNFKSRQ